eukprot:TRINITY_DN259_c1_g1_i1.p1 TRINITY_DN259_c1_g1~~TRINITY_DN259_c1_g1_i1.p1  ORF type:complete len:1286 (+),score=248.43 TRINITY_DN259_c1_g1_i1:26-3883(+)
MRFPYFAPLLCASTAFGAVFYVAPGGDDAGDGSEGAPFQTVDACAAALRAVAPEEERRCVMRGGVYKLTNAALFDGLYGTADSRVVLEGAAGEEVVFDGTIDLDAATWTQSADVCPSAEECYYTDYFADNPGLPEFWQLFADGELLDVARWPNALFTDRTSFDAARWARSGQNSTFEGGKFVVSRVDAGNRRNQSEPYGDSIMVDDTHACEEDGGGDAAGHGGCNPVAGGLGDLTLRNGDAIDVTGAMALMNIASWLSFAAVVTSHTPGNGSFAYRSGPDWPVQKFRGEENIYVLENKLEFLDAGGEWFFDNATRRLYARLPGDVDPGTVKMQARVQRYALAVSRSHYLTVRNMEFFATGLFAGPNEKFDDTWPPSQDPVDQVAHCHFEALRFRYGGGAPRVLGAWDDSLIPLVVSTDQDGTLVYDCEFYGIDGHPLQVDRAPAGQVPGQVSLVNNLLEYIDWTVLSFRPPRVYAPSDTPYADSMTLWSSWQFTYSLVVGKAVAGAPNVVERNTLMHHGASEGIQVMLNTRVRLNRIGHKYALQMDGASIQTISANGWDEASGVDIDSNWIHDTQRARGSKWGVRIDRVNSRCWGAALNEGDQTWGFNGNVTRNVVVRTLGISIKGNRHRVEHNTMLFSGGEDSEGIERDSFNGGLEVYNADTKGTCTCTGRGGRDLCSNFPGQCCDAGNNNTFENRLTVLRHNLFGAPDAKQGGTSYYPDTAAVDEFLGSPLAEANTGALHPEALLRDAINWDFRPLGGSAVAATCAGAYPAGLTHGHHYWIPGRQSKAASTPIPPHGSEVAAVVPGAVPDGEVGSTYDVMFLQGLNAERHRVFAGTNGSALAFIGEMWGEANIFTLPASLAIAAGTTVQWRVDAVTNGTVIAGEVWEFAVAAAPAAPRAGPTCDEHVYAEGVSVADDGSSSTASPTAQQTLAAQMGQFEDTRRVTSLTICANLTAATTMSEFELQGVVRWGPPPIPANTPEYLILSGRFPDTTATSMQVCFSDGAAEAFPSDPWAAAHDGQTYAPVSPMLPFLADQGVTLNVTTVTVALKLFDRKVDGMGGAVDGWSITVCSEPYGDASDTYPEADCEALPVLPATPAPDYVPPTPTTSSSTTGSTSIASMNAESTNTTTGWNATIESTASTAATTNDAVTTTTTTTNGTTINSGASQGGDESVFPWWIAVVCVASLFGLAFAFLAWRRAGRRLVSFADTIDMNGKDDACTMVSHSQALPQDLTDPFKEGLLVSGEFGGGSSPSSKESHAATPLARSPRSSRTQQFVKVYEFI